MLGKNVVVFIRMEDSVSVEVYKHRVGLKIICALE